MTPACLHTTCRVNHSSCVDFVRFPLALQLMGESGRFQGTALTETERSFVHVGEVIYTRLSYPISIRGGPISLGQDRATYVSTDSLGRYILHYPWEENISIFRSRERSMRFASNWLENQKAPTNLVSIFSSFLSFSYFEPRWFFKTTEHGFTDHLPPRWWRTCHAHTSDRSLTSLQHRRWVAQFWLACTYVCTYLERCKNRLCQDGTARLCAARPGCVTVHAFATPGRPILAIVVPVFHPYAIYHLPMIRTNL